MRHKRTKKRRQAGASGKGQPVVSVRLSRAEYDAFRAHAEGLGLTPNALMRAITRDHMGWKHDDTR